MSIFAGKPPEPQQTEIDPPLGRPVPLPAVKPEGKPEASGHPLTDGPILDMLDRTDR